MAFDPDAYLAETGGFDPDAYLADGDAPQELAEQPQGDTLGQDALDVLGEFAAGANRSVTELIDFLGPGAINNILSLAGVEARVPTLTGALEPYGIRGGFMEEGTARDVVSAAGASLPAAAGMATVAGRDVTKPLGAAAEMLGIGQAAPSATLGKEVADIVPGFAETSSRAVKVPGVKDAEETINLSQQGGDLQKYIANPEDPEKADFVIKGGKLVKDPIASQAIKQGVDPNLVAMVKTASPETRKKMRAQLEILKRGKKNLRYQNQFRPWDVAGKSMADRVKFLRDVNREGGKEVNQAAKALAGEFVDYTPAIDSFITRLNDNGVVVVRGADGKIKPDFSQSIFRSSGKPQKIIRDIINHLDTDNPVDAREVHIAKKYIDELVNWGGSATGNAGQVEGIAKNLRGDLNRVLGDAFPDYREANTKYSETLSALEDIRKSSGAKVKIDDDEFNQAVGTGLRRVLSNAQAGAPLRSAMKDAEDLVVKYGGGFPDDIRDQISFAERLDAMFGSSAKTSIGGEMDKTADRVADTALGQKTLTGLAAEGVKAGYKAARGVNEENAIKALETLLSTEY